MWRWWVFTSIHNCESTFWFTANNVKNPRKSQFMSFNWQPNIFWQYYFLHMCDAPKIRHFEPIEHNFWVKWFKKWVFCLAAFSCKISRFWNFCMNWFLIKFIQWTCNFIEGGIFLLYKSLKSIVLLYAFLLIPLKKMQFRHLI